MARFIEGGGCTVIGTAHLNKKTDTPIVQRILGASGIANFVRSNWTIQRDDEDKTLRLFLRLKANLVPGLVDGLQFRIQHVGPWQQSIVCAWCGTTEKTPDGVMNGNKVAKSAVKWLLVDRPRHLVSVVSLSTDTNGGQVATVGWESSEPVAPLDFLKGKGDVRRDEIMAAAAEAGYTERAVRQAKERHPEVVDFQIGYPARAWFALDRSQTRRGQVRINHGGEAPETASTLLRRAPCYDSSQVSQSWSQNTVQK